MTTAIRARALPLTLVIALTMLLSPIATLSGPGPAAAAGDVLATVDHETGDLSQWSSEYCGGIYNTGSGVASASRAVAHSGNYSARLSISGADGSTGNQAVRMFRWCEAQKYTEAYYSVWYYFPQRYTPRDWWNVFQFKSKTPSRNDPFFILNVGNRSNGAMHFYLFDWVQRNSYSQSVADIPVGRWFHVEAYYRSSATKDGQITLWQDGVKLFDVNGVQTRYSDGDTEWSVNNYTDGISPADVTIYADDAVISTTRTGGAPIASSVMAPIQRFVPNTQVATNAIPLKLTWSASGSFSSYRLHRSDNGGAYANEPLPAGAPTSKISWLKPGNGYRYRINGADGAGNTTDWAYGTPVRIAGHQDTSGAITYSTYSGTWRRAAVQGAHDGYVKYATASGASAKFRFTGKDVAWVTAKTPGSGRARIYVDGSYVGTVDLYSSKSLLRRLVFARSWSASGSHTLEVRVVGTAGRPRVDVDSFLVIS